MGTLTKETSKMLIRESKKYLQSYHINLRKYNVTVTQNEDDVAATVIFTSKITGNIIYAHCHYNNEEILQCGIYL